MTEYDWHEAEVAYKKRIQDGQIRLIKEGRFDALVANGKAYGNNTVVIAADRLEDILNIIKERL